MQFGLEFTFLLFISLIEVSNPSELTTRDSRFQMSMRKLNDLTFFYLINKHTWMI